MRGAPLQTREESEAAIDWMEQDFEDKKLLTSAFDKVSRKYERLAPQYRAKQDENILMKLTVGELRVLRQFGRKYHDG